MATYITDICINCDACREECPVEAISMGPDIYIIDPNLCVECVGFDDKEACQSVCPVECCLPDPKNQETQEILLERAKRIYPETKFPDPLPPNLTRFSNPDRQKVPDEK